MSYNHRIIFLSLSIFSSSLVLANPPINVKPLNEPDASEIIQNFINNEQQTQPIAQQPPFNEVDIKEMTFVFAKSPKAAQCIVNHLQDPLYFPLNENYRSAIFVGEPGTGKTATAKAIAHKMAEKGWEYKFIPSTLFLGEHRNKTAILLQNELEAIKKSKKKTILIIDELNLLMENSESKNHDTDATAKALWIFIDQQKDNKDFFFIGTMNRANKLPQAYKSRIIFDYIKFPLIHDIQFKTEFIRTTLTTQKTELDAEVTDAFLNKELEKMGSCSGRDLKNISSAICRTNKMNFPAASASTNAPPVMVIKKAAIITAIDQYVKNKIELDYDIKEETDEERQNRHHKENREAHERQFVQQQMIQIALKEYVNLHNDGSISSSRGNKIIEDALSDEQQKFYDNMVKRNKEKNAARGFFG
jgi:AAA+ superfamily predicted ATPase